MIKELKKSTAKTFGELIKNEMTENPRFYLFSPDETTSNKLDAVYEVSSRAWSNLEKKPQDLPESSDGKIVELLSENVLFAVMLGHILAGEPAMMTSYEAFFTIITSQIIQHLKFLTQSEEVAFRPAYPAVNLLSTSTCWRQDHNGYSHQSPILISSLLDHPSNKVNCFFPVDSESARAVYQYMIKSQNVVNFTTFNKTDEPQYLDPNHADYQILNGASIFDFASDGNTFDLKSPENQYFDFIFTAAGDIATRESLEAMKLLRKDLPHLKLRFINILALSYEKIGTIYHQMSQETFDDFFTTTAPIIANFHGFPNTLKNILANYADQKRILSHGFIEQGSTTTPFEMLALNKVSRFDLAIDVAEKLNRFDLIDQYQSRIDENRNYAKTHGVDLIQI